VGFFAKARMLAGGRAPIFPKQQRAIANRGKAKVSFIVAP
jgi:hypothetical protein